MTSPIPMLTLLSVPDNSKHPLVGKHLTIKSFPAIIGRGQDATIVIKHRRLSRLHCRLFQNEGQTFVKDLGSTNGTFVDGEKVHSEVALTPGCRISVGGIEFMVTMPMNLRQDPSGRCVLPTNLTTTSKKQKETVFIPASEDPTVEESLEEQDHIRNEHRADLPGSENPTDLYQMPVQDLDPEAALLAEQRKEHANRNDAVQDLIQKFDLRNDSESENHSDSHSPISLLDTVESEPNPEVVFDPTPVQFDPSLSPAEKEFRKQIEQSPAKRAEGIKYTNQEDQQELENISIKTGKKRPKTKVEDINVSGLGGPKPTPVIDENLQLGPDRKPKSEVSEKELGNFFIRRKKKDK